MNRLIKLFVAGLFALFALIIIVAAGVWWHLNPTPPAHQLWVNGQIITLNGDQAEASAIEIRGERITWLGDTQTAETRRHANTTYIDLQGATVLPGFIEAHGHFPGAGLFVRMVDLNAPPIADIDNLDTLQRRLKAQANELPSGDWVLGMGYDDSLLAENRHPTRVDLDAISSEHPIYIIHVSGHMGVANSLALKKLGIDANTPDPDGGEIRRDGNGAATGLLLELAHKPVMKRLLKFPPLEQLNITREAARLYAEQGFTTVQNGLALKAHISGLRLARKIGLVPQRIVVWPDYEQALTQLEAGKSLPTGNDVDFHVGAVKFQGDGSIQGYTGWLSEAYYDSGEHPVDWRGTPAIAPKALRKMVHTVHCAEHQVAIHANGDAAIDAALDALAQAQKACPRSDTRHIIIHAQMTRPDQLLRMHSLRVTPSFFSAHTWFWGDRHRQTFIGPERAAQISPAGTATTVGLPFTTHLDTPVVPIDWWRQLNTPVTRQTSGGMVLGGNERISPQQSLKAMTLDAAWQMGLEDEIGSIKVGKYADLVVLSANPLSVDSDAVINPGIQIRQTVVGGRTIYTAAD